MGFRGSRESHGSPRRGSAGIGESGGGYGWGWFIGVFLTERIICNNKMIYLDF